MNFQYDWLYKVTTSLLKSAVEIGCEVQAIWRHKTMSIIRSIQFYNCRKKRFDSAHIIYINQCFMILLEWASILTAIPTTLFCTRHHRRTQAFWFSWPRARLNHRLHTISPRGIAASMDTDWDIHRYNTVIHLNSSAKTKAAFAAITRQVLSTELFLSNLHQLFLSSAVWGAEKEDGLKTSKVQRNENKWSIKPPTLSGF